MARFRYQAIDADGIKTDGIVNAVSKAAAYRTLSDQGLSAFAINENSETEASGRVTLTSMFPRQLSLHATSDLCRVLSEALAARLSLQDALAVSQDAVADRFTRSTLRKIARTVDSGQTIEDAFASQSKVLPLELPAFVVAGAAGDRLAGAFKDAAQYFRERQETRDKIVAATTYPLVLITLTFLVFALVLTFVIPSFSQVFGLSDRAAPPLIDRLIEFRSFLAENGLLVGTALSGGVLLAVAFRKTLARALQRLLPAYGNHLREEEFLRIVRQLRLLLVAGQDLRSAFIRSSETTEGQIKKILDECVAALTDGDDLGRLLGGHRFVPRTFGRLFALGYRTNRLPEMLALAGDLLKDSTNIRRQRFIASLAPILTLIVGGLIAVLVSTLLSAVLELSQVPL